MEKHVIVRGAHDDTETAHFRDDGRHTRMHGHAPLCGSKIGSAAAPQKSVEPVLSSHPFDQVEAVLALINIVVPAIRLAVTCAPTVLSNYDVSALSLSNEGLNQFRVSSTVRRTHSYGGRRRIWWQVKVRRQTHPITHRDPDCHPANIQAREPSRSLERT